MPVCIHIKCEIGNCHAENKPGCNTAAGTANVSVFQISLHNN